MSKDKDQKITGGWAFLNNPDPSPSSSKNRAANGPRSGIAAGPKSGFTAAAPPPEVTTIGPWLKKYRWPVLGGIAAVLLIGVGTWYAVLREPTPQEDRAAIQGEWRITKQGGTPGHDEGQMSIRIQGDRWTFVVGGKDVTTWQMELRPDADPREFDLTQIEREGQPIKVTGPTPKMLGVYAVDRKTLRIAMAPEANGRPKGLDDPDVPAMMLTKAK